MPSGTAGSNWGTFIRGMLNLGQFPSAAGSGDLRHSLLALQQVTSNPSNYTNLGKAVAGSVDQGYLDIFLQVDCVELYDSFQGASVLKDGKLVTAGPNLCAGRNFSPYDSGKYYISTPIYYFQGEVDPAAPLSQALYHFRNHGAASRTFVQLAGIGHFPLQKAISGCKQKIWSSISSGDGKLLETLRQCHGVKSVSSRDVEVNATELQLQSNWN
jgi:pimeloyl-ACP methyl ester carboxylesterase